MLVVSCPRRGGKTTRLLNIVREFFPTPDTMLIVTPYPRQRRDLLRLLDAEERWATRSHTGDILPNVVAASSLDDLVRLRERLQGSQPRHVFIDNLDTLVESLFWPHRVEVVTLTRGREAPDDKMAELAVRRTEQAEADRDRLAAKAAAWDELGAKIEAAAIGYNAPQLVAIMTENREVRADRDRLATEVERMRALAKQATNGWACYAKRNIEHREIARLHREIDAALAEAPTPKGASDE